MSELPWAATQYLTNNILVANNVTLRLSDTMSILQCIILLSTKVEDNANPIKYVMIASGPKANEPIAPDVVYAKKR